MGDGRHQTVPRRGAFHGTSLSNDGYSAAAPNPTASKWKECLQYPVPIMRPCRFKGEASEHQSQAECVSVSQVRTIPGWCLRSLCLLHGHPAGEGLGGPYSETAERHQLSRRESGYQKETAASADEAPGKLAPLEERDRVYRALLNRLTLAPDHRENLLSRGLTDEAIERLGYKSTPVVGFHALAQSLLDEGYTLFGVPGFYRDKDGRWTMAVWRRGILIPGTYFGKIQGFQIRLDHKMKKGGKFLTFSSRDELDGAMGENWCHMVGPVRERILLIEGYMKADIVNHFTGQTMLAIPGVTSLQHLESALRDLIPMGVRHIMTCFDMDYLKNWHVESAYQNLVELLAKQNVTFGTYLWVPDYNGLDDYIWEFCMNKGNPPK